MKSWVILRMINTGIIHIWRDYDNGTIWDSPIYEVLGYFEGSYRDAKKHSQTL